MHGIEHDEEPEQPKKPKRGHAKDKRATWDEHVASYFDWLGNQAEAEQHRSVPATVGPTDRRDPEPEELEPEEPKRGLTIDEFLREYIKSPTWAEKSRKVFAIHGSRCYRCGTTEGPLQVHHLHYGTLGHEDPRHDLRIACIPCHRKEHEPVHEDEPDVPEEPKKPKPAPSRYFPVRRKR